jgi:CheY-like chemotaxis protein
MPGLNGREVLSSIKADERLRVIPVVILTTSSDEKDVNECYKIGASTYIQKPVTFEGLTNAIRALRDYWFEIAIFPS